MTSKWIEQLYKDVDNDDLWELCIQHHVERIDALLFRAMLSVDDQQLSDEISEEINGTE